MRGTLVSIDAYNRRSGTRVTVRVGAARNAATLGAGGFTWEPALRRAPRLSMQLADDDLTGNIQVGQAEFALKMNQLNLVGDPRDFDWAGSPVTIYSGDGAALGRYKTELVGRIVSGVPNADTGIIPITIEADRSIVDVPLLNLTYGGGGGADGDVEIRGTNKPAGYGSPINIQPVLINAVLAIYQVDGYGNTQSIAGVYEDLASFGAATQDYATYAALEAAAITEGRFATCLAQGMFRLGAPASGTITCDPVFGAGLPGSMMLRWLRTHAGLSDTRIRVSDFDALTAAVQAAVGTAPTVSFWTADSVTVLDLMQRMCASCNAVPLVMLNGTIGVSRVIGGPTALTMKRQGGTPPITAWQSADPPTPWWRLRMSAARSFYVNSPAEIDYLDDIKDMGDYSATETYRQGMVVRAPDGARYLYTNATPSSGHQPPDDAYWEIYEASVAGSTLTPRGDFDIGATYRKGDIVQDGDTSWVYIADAEGSGHALPAPPATENAYWQLIGGMTPTQAAALLLAQQRINAISSDDIITAGAEKQQLRLSYDQLTVFEASASASSDALNTIYGGDPTGAQRSAAFNALFTLNQWLNAQTPAWDNIDVDTPLDGTYLRQLFTAAYTAANNLVAANSAFIRDRQKATQDRVLAIGDDGVISAGQEKSDLIINYLALANDFAALDARYVSLGSPSDITADRNNAFNWKVSLENLLLSYAPPWNTISVDTPIPDTDVYRSAWTVAENTLSVFAAAITGRKGDKGEKGDDGTSAYAVIQSNQSHILPAAADGSIMSYSGAATTIKIYANGQEETANFTLSIANNPQALAFNIDQETKTVAITDGFDASEANAFLLLRMTGSGAFAGIVLDQQFNLTKSRAGADGSSPALISLTVNPQIVRYDGSGNAIAGQALRAVVTRQNNDGAAVFVIYNVDGSVLYGPYSADFYVNNVQGEWFAGSGGDTLAISAAYLPQLINAHGGSLGRISIGVWASGRPDIRDITSIQKVRDGTPGINAPLVLTQWSIDGSSNWHANYFGADQYYRQSNDNGATYGPAIRGVGESGDVGIDGISPSNIFKRSSIVPPVATDNTGNPPPTWFDGPPDGTTFIWQSSAKFRGSTQLTSWTTPQRISGDDGAPAIGITLAGSRQTATFNADGSLTASQAVDFRASRQNTTAAAVWTVLDAVRNVIGGPAPAQAFVDAFGSDKFATTNNDALGLTQAGVAWLFANFTAPFAVRVTVGASAVAAEASLARVTNGAVGDPGPAGPPGGTVYGSVPGLVDLGVQPGATVSLAGYYSSYSHANIWCEAYVSLSNGGSIYLGYVGSGSSGSMSISGNWTNNTGAFQAVTLILSVSADDGGGVMIPSGDGNFSASVT